MRDRMPVLYCDGDEGECNAWERDFYEMTAHSVDGVRITATERAPGWQSTKDDRDFCPKHAAGGLKDG